MNETLNPLHWAYTRIVDHMPQYVARRGKLQGSIGCIETMPELSVVVGGGIKMWPAFNSFEGQDPYSFRAAESVTCKRPDQQLV